MTILLKYVGVRVMESERPNIPASVKMHLWLRAGGRCEFKGCNKILYEDDVTQNPINGSNIAHIISWKETGPRGDKELSPKLAKDISNLMLTCPEHNHLIDSGDNVEKYTVSFLQEMKLEHERSIRELTGITTHVPLKVIEFKSMIQGQRPAITEKDEADALFPFYPRKERIIIDVCEIADIASAKSFIDNKVKRHITDSDESELYAAFIMATIPLSCYLGYLIGNKISVRTYQHFRDTEDWKWRGDGEGFTVNSPNLKKQCSDVNLLINISGIIDTSLTNDNYPIYSINANKPGFDFLQSFEQVQEFRKIYREILDKIRIDNGEMVVIHLYPATPNPISFEIGKGIMKNLDPTIVLYDKTASRIKYKEVMHLHDRIRKSKGELKKNSRNDSADRISELL